MPQAVETIIARCLLEPAFLDQLESPGASSGFDKAELEKIRRFAGFICKVKHNHLWGLFPATRRLIAHYDIELDIFTKYRFQHAWPATVEDPIRSFINFLEAYLSSRRTHPYVMMSDVLRHERFIWETRQPSQGPPVVEQAIGANELHDLQWFRFQRLTAVLDPSLRLSSFKYDVQSIVSQLEETNIADKTPRQSGKFLAYYLDQSSSSVRVLEVDRITAHLLSLINGNRSVRRVISAARASGLGHARPRHFREFFEEAHRTGFIHLLPQRGFAQKAILGSTVAASPPDVRRGSAPP